MSQTKIGISADLAHLFEPADVLSEIERCLRSHFPTVTYKLSSSEAVPAFSLETIESIVQVALIGATATVVSALIAAIAAVIVKRAEIPQRISSAPPESDSRDLLLTLTDSSGAVVTVRVHDKVVEEAQIALLREEIIIIAIRAAAE